VRSRSAQRPDNFDRDEEKRHQTGREQFVGDEGRERRQGGALRESIVIDRPDEAGSECRRQKNQDENKSLQGRQDQHAPSLAQENLAVQQALKCCVVTV
jgi:hypothetical protein